MNASATDVSSMFALLYILAQAVERVVELISDFNLWGDPKSSDAFILHRRAAALWILSSILGMIVCYWFDIDFFRFLIPAGATQPVSVSHGIISGIIVGSGTKPVHDVISGIEKFARKSK